MDTTPDPLYEQLASIQHTIWSHWMRYLLGECVEVHDDGSCTIEVDRANAWWRQIDTPYEHLSEREKDSDREQVDRFWSLIPRMSADDALAADFVEANAKLGDGLTEIGMILGLPKPRPGATWGVPEVLLLARELMGMVGEQQAPLADRLDDEGARHLFAVRDALRRRGVEPGNDAVGILRHAAEALSGDGDRGAHTFPIMDLS